MKYKIGTTIHINLTDKQFASGQTIALRVRAIVKQGENSNIYFDCEGISLYMSDKDGANISLTNSTFLSEYHSRICGMFIDESNPEDIIYSGEYQVELFLPL
jgi:hypothetical protein